MQSSICSVEEDFLEVPVQISLNQQCQIDKAKNADDNQGHIQENRMEDKVTFISTMMDISTSTTLASARGDLSLIGFTKRPDLDWPWSL